jgi:Rieske Fe-S protein
MKPFQSDTSRRRFLKLFYTGTIVGAAGGRLLRSNVLWAAEPGYPQTPGLIRVPLADYPTLDEVDGSIRLSVNPITGGSESYPFGDFYPVMLTRRPDVAGLKQFIALDCECRHASCVVESFNGSYIECRCHGSQYDVTGQVLSGPATEPLRVLKHTYDGAGLVTVEVPNLGYHAVPELADGSRLKLSFFGLPEVGYRVLARNGFGPGTEWTEVPFSTTPGGPLNQSVYTGVSMPVSLYVEAAGNQAYYSVSVDLLEY